MEAVLSKRWKTLQSAEQVFRWLLGSLWLLALFFSPYDFWSLGQVSELWQRRSLLDAWWLFRLLVPGIAVAMFPFV